MPEPGFHAWRSVADIVGVALTRRLLRHDSAPIAIGLSGGGDSLALLIAAHRWAVTAGRPLIALTVDHGLQAAGRDWAPWCRARAERLGIEHRTLYWRGDKPATGLPAAARAARHALLADAARRAGSAVILLGHTADDCLEAQAMRAAGARVSAPRGWAPSPAWPEGRGLFLLRPLLASRRADLRAWLEVLGETWIEDPANLDPASGRAQARRRLQGGGCSPPETPGPMAAHFLPAVNEGVAGELIIDRKAFTPDFGDVARTMLRAALLCAAGTARPPRGARLDRLVALIGSGVPFVATLAGARVEGAPDVIRIMAGDGDHRRGREIGLALPLDEEVVFEGRFCLRAARPGLIAHRLAGRLGQLDPVQRRALAAAPPRARGALPCLATEDARRVTCATLVDSADIAVRSLIMPRLAAACGAINDEATIRAWQNR